MARAVADCKLPLQRQPTTANPTMACVLARIQGRRPCFLGAGRLIERSATGEGKLSPAGVTNAVCSRSSRRARGSLV